MSSRHFFSGRVFGLIVCVTIALCGLSGCKKISYDLTKNKAPKDAPKYTVEFQQNLSPAEEGVRKPTS